MGAISSRYQNLLNTRGLSILMHALYEGRFYVRREIDLMKTAKIKAYIIYTCIFRMIGLLSTCNLKLFKNALL